MHLALTGADRNKLLMSLTVAAVKKQAAKRRLASRAADVAEKVTARRRSLDDAQVGEINPLCATMRGRLVTPTLTPGTRRQLLRRRPTTNISLRRPLHLCNRADYGPR